MDRGYFALWRKFQDHRFWKEKRVFSKAEAWIDILWEAQHEKEPQGVILGMKLLVCNYGETLKSIRTWAKRWGWGESKVHRFLKLLKIMGQIDTVNETVTTRISILNYKEYDPRNPDSGTQMERKWNASETQAVTDKNDKKEKKEKNSVLCPQKKILNLYKNLLPELPQPKTWDGIRAANLRARWNEKIPSDSGKAHSGQVEYWDGLFKFIRESDFLMGKVPPTQNHQQFNATLEWIVKKSNFLKIVEGKYAS